MSSATPAKKAAEPRGEVVALMRRMGVKGHPFDPMPPDQHRWQRRRGEDPLHRLWSWMTGHTVAFHHRSEYAVNDDGRELHMEHAAKDLEMELPNVYHAWKEGVEKGIFRSGTKEEGKRRLYLCGAVKPEPASSSEAGDGSKIGCTDNFPSHIRKQIKDWPQQKVEELRRAIEAEERLEKETLAAAVAATRTLFTQRKDTVYASLGVNLNSQSPHIKRGESPEDAIERLERVQPLLPGLQMYVQTIASSVQTPESTVYEPLYSDSTDNASLLRQNNPEEARVRAPAGNSVGRGGPLKPHARDGGKPAKYLHTDEAADESASEPQTPAENTALETLFTEVGRMQSAFKHSDFARERVDRDRKSDRVTLLKILRTVGAGNVLAFCLYIASEFKGLDRNSLGKLPPRSPDDPHGPRSLGLILTWANRWAAERSRGLGGSS